MKRESKKNKSIILRLIVLAVFAYFAVTLVNLWGSLNDSLAELKALNAQLASTENEVKELHSMLEADSDKPLIEKAARERLGYIYSDEQVFIDISGD